MFTKTEAFKLATIGSALMYFVAYLYQKNLEHEVAQAWDHGYTQGRISGLEDHNTPTQYQRPSEVK